MQPLRPHENWHIDIAYVNLSATFYYLCTVLDRCSHYIVHWNVRESMTEEEVEVLLQRGRERYPGETPWIISDNGPQFVAKDFKEFLRVCGMSHVRTSPYYPQSNGKIERFHRTLKSECLRPRAPLTLQDARPLVSGNVDYYNNERLHRAIGYVAPCDNVVWQGKRDLRATRSETGEAREQRETRREAAGVASSPANQEHKTKNS
ncbi:MAG: transposase [Gemmataceae bacterium]